MASTDLDSPDWSADAVVAEARSKAADNEAEAQWPTAPAGAGKGTPGTTHTDEGVRRFMANLPRNITVGLVDAAVNTADAIGSTRPADAKDTVQTPFGPRADFGPALYGEAKQAVQGFRDHLAANSDTADEITQGVAQFAIPYTGFAKAFGVARAAGFVQNLFGLAAADIATSTTVLEPHAGRMADLVELGKHTEGKLGAALNTIAPDGGLASKYIDWMTARDGETEFEGRFKNAVDTLVTNAATAGILKAAGGTFRAARTIVKNADLIGTGPVAGSPAAQAGKISFTAAEERPLGNLASERTGAMTDEEFVLPGSQVIRAQQDGKDVGFIAFRENDAGALQINRTKVHESLRGRGTGKELLLKALDAADAQGKPLVSDNTVTAAQLRVYDSLEKAGKIKVEYSNPEAVIHALGDKDQRTVVKGKGGPVVTKIERITETKPETIYHFEPNTAAGQQEGRKYAVYPLTEDTFQKYVVPTMSAPRSLDEYLAEVARPANQGEIPTKVVVTDAAPNPLFQVGSDAQIAQYFSSRQQYITKTEHPHPVKGAQ